jgi:hypothetical protein
MNANNINKTKQNKKAKYKVSTVTEHKCFYPKVQGIGAMYHIVKDKSFSGQNPDPLRGIFL